MTERGAQERVIFNEKGVQITDKRAVLGSKTYSIANITSVASVEIKPSVALPIVMMGLGILSFAAYVVMLSAAQNVTELLLLGIALLVVGFIWYRFQGGKTYVVRIGSASGEVDGMYSPDQDYIERIVKAMNDAIVMR